MQVIINPGTKDWQTLLQRPYADNATVLQSVQAILTDVKSRGDEAVKELTQKFTGVVLDDFAVSISEMNAASDALAEELKTAILQSKQNIEVFHRRHLASIEVVETMQGIQY